MILLFPTFWPVSNIINVDAMSKGMIELINIFLITLDEVEAGNESVGWVRSSFGGPLSGGFANWMLNAILFKEINN